MSGNLDDFLRQEGERKQKDEAAQRTEMSDHSRFRYAFRDALKDIIHPTMMDKMEALRQNGHFGKKVREKVRMEYLYERYLIIATGIPMQAEIWVIANHRLHKVCMVTEFFSLAEGSGNRTSFKRSETQHQLSEVTPIFLDTLVVNLIRELLASG
ncbi:MAG: hypothetical protein EPN85_04465 [Bacteroidetes bacterium]|nr:MAG: hypothetical protein EPN85_04465 [Bacteroidota bacterium]